MFQLMVEKRAELGKKVKGLRARGIMPAVAYGPKDGARSLAVPVTDFKKLLQQAGESSVVSLQIGAERKEVLIHEVIFHPVSGEPLHADFYIVESGKLVTVKIPLEFQGQAPAVKNLGATLVKVLHELEIEALPKDLPQRVTIDVSSLADLTGQILVRDLPVPAGVKVLNHPEEVVAAIAEMVVEEEAPAEPVDLTKIEVEKRGKKEEEAVAEEGEKEKAAA